MKRHPEAVAAALDAAKHRRARLLASKGVDPPETPETGARGGTKRGLKSEAGPSTASTTAATLSSGAEKITPDPKHVRTEGDGEPTPRALFVSPPGGHMDVEQGGLLWAIGWEKTQPFDSNHEPALQPIYL